MILLVGLAILLGGVLSGCVINPPREVYGPRERTTQTRSEARTETPRVDGPGAAEVANAERLLEGGSPELALASFERAIEINPELTPAYLGAGDIYREQGNYEAAEERYGEAARRDPRSFDAQYLHGLSLQFLERFTEAVRAYLRALAIRPDDVEANTNLSVVYLSIGEPEQARVYAARAVRLEPGSGEARATLGSAYAALGDHLSAVAEYRQAAELMEITPELMINLADSLSKADRHDEAIATLQRVVDEEPSAAALERLGAAQFRARAYADAEASFQGAIDLDASHYPALNGLGVCMLNRYHWGGESDMELRGAAVRLLRRSLQINPQQNRIIGLVRKYG